MTTLIELCKPNPLPICRCPHPSDPDYELQMALMRASAREQELEKMMERPFGTVILTDKYYEI